MSLCTERVSVPSRACCGGATSVHVRCAVTSWRQAAARGEAGRLEAARSSKRRVDLHRVLSPRGATAECGESRRGEEAWREKERESATVACAPHFGHTHTAVAGALPPHRKGCCTKAARTAFVVFFRLALTCPCGCFVAIWAAARHNSALRLCCRLESERQYDIHEFDGSSDLLVTTALAEVLQKTLSSRSKAATHG